MSGSPAGGAGQVIVLMGVAGCGKTTIGKLLAREIGGVFEDADNLHPPENVKRMAAGAPLGDAERWPWLRKIRRRMEEAAARDETLVIACSALKAAYRDFLRESRARVRFVYLKGSREQIASRLQARRGHFMAPPMLESQFAALEEPGPEEAAIVAIDREPAEIVREIRGIAGDAKTGSKEGERERDG